jgi:hypothetical protein
MDTMKPDELREWAHAIRDVLQDFLPNRDSWVWAWAWRASLAILAMAYTEPDMLPAGWADQIIHWGGIVGMVAGKMGWSLAGSPEPRTVFLPPPMPMPPNVAIVPKDGGQ